jgi:hypothetical protein
MQFDHIHPLYYSAKELNTESQVYSKNSKRSQTAKKKCLEKEEGS